MEPELPDPAHDEQFYVCEHCTAGRHASCVIVCATCRARCVCHLKHHPRAPA